MPHTLAQLEAFVSSSAYDADTAGLIARGIPELPRLKGEQIAPGITRIHGNLCNVHGRYGPCDKAKSGGKKPKGRKPIKTDAQRAAERDAKRSANVNDVGDQLDAADTLAGIDAYDKGRPLDPAIQQDIINAGLGELGRDGAMRLTAQGREALHAAQRGDVGAARDALSRGRDTRATGQERTTAQQTRRQAAAQRQAAIQAKRQVAQAKRDAAAKKPAKAAAGGGKKQPEKPAVEQPRAAPKRRARTSVPSGATGAGSGAAKPKPKAPRLEKAPAKQIAPALQVAAQSLSDGKKLTEADTQSLIRNGLARLVKGELVLTAAGMRQTLKEHATARWNGTAWVNARGDIVPEPDQSQFAGYTMEDWDDEPKRKPSRQAVEAARAQFAKALGVDTVAQPSTFKVFKDASGHYRWVAQSSTAFQDRDEEIVSTKALADDCAFADETGSYGPLRWWHSPGLDLGDCDFNAMHGRVLIESGTFRTPAIAQKVAQAAGELEISLGFLHLPTEPDAAGVFHHIRRFERSLVPRGKASNRFTAFAVKETTMLDATKVAALKTLGFSDTDIAGLQSQAAATEKAATDQGVAYKADEPHFIHSNGSEGAQPGQRFKAANGDEYIKSPSELDPTGMYYATKAMPPMMQPDAETPAEDAAEGGMEEPGEADAGGLTLSPEDLSAIGEAIGAQLQGVAAQIMGALDLEKKVAGHVQGLMQPYTAQKDASDAEKAEAITALQTSLKAAQDQQTALKAQLDELMGLQPAIVQRPSESADTKINPWLDQQLLGAVKEQLPADQQFAFGDLVSNLFGNINGTPGQA